MTNLFLEDKNLPFLTFPVVSRRGWGRGRGKAQTLLSRYTSLGCSPKLFSFPVSHHCWPETNRLPVISPAKMSIFWISREFNFGVCHHSVQAPICQRKESCIEGERNWDWEGYGKSSVWRFIVWVPARKEERSFFLLGSTIIARLESSPFWSPDCLIEVSVD